jgi:hypothetical protein
MRTIRLLLLLAMAAAFQTAAWAYNYQGWVDEKDCSYLSVWAWNGVDDTALNVNIYDNGAFLMTVTANQFRQDLLNEGIGNGYHSFKMATPYQLMDGKNHFISAIVNGTTFYLLLNNGNAVNCAVMPNVDVNGADPGNPLVPHKEAHGGGTGQGCSSLEVQRKHSVAFLGPCRGPGAHKKVEQ